MEERLKAVEEQIEMLVELMDGVTQLSLQLIELSAGVVNLTGEIGVLKDKVKRLEQDRFDSVNN